MAFGSNVAACTFILPFRFSNLVDRSDDCIPTRNRKIKVGCLFSVTCRLLQYLENANSFVLKRIQPLFAKHRGCGVENIAVTHLHRSLFRQST
jgi:hypothetical protein